MTSAASDGKGSLRMSSSPPLIRAALPSDIPALVNLVGQYWSFEGIPGFDARRIECLLRAALFAEGRAQCWLAEEAGELGGYLLAVLVFSLEHGGMMAEIDEFFVTAASRRRGIGAALLLHAENALRATGVGRLQLQLGSAKARARDFYAARGYGRRAGFELWDKGLPPPVAD
jgi:GNAT superfamily N-acetyltransferase